MVYHRKSKKKARKLPPIPEKTSVRPPENFQTAACFLLPSPSFARMATAFAQTTAAFVQMPVPAEVSSRMIGISHPHKPMFSPAWAKECPRTKRHRHPSTIANQPQCFLTFFVHLRQTIGIPQMARFIDLFAGIGGIRIPFDELGYQCVFSSEWDKAACDTYEANFGERPQGDITEIPAEAIPAHDLLLAGFPCQAFSIMGKMQGFADTRGTMFFEIERILSYHKPSVILLENVKQLTTHDKGKTFKIILSRLKGLGYLVKWEVLNALDFGLPQKRERVIIVGFRNERDFSMFNFDFIPQEYNLADILEKDEDVDKSLFASERIVQKRLESTKGKQIFYPSVWHENKAGNISVLDYACALRTGASYNYLLVNGCRRPSSRELLRLQGFPDSYKIVVSHQEIRRQTGNSVAVPMIRAIAQKINNIIKEEHYETA